MSIVAYRSGIIAGDMSTWFGSYRHATTRKISRNPNGCLIGAVGETWRAKNFLGLSMAEDPLNVAVDLSGDAGGMVVRKDGAIWVFEGQGKYRIDDAYYAMGAGSPVAMGAMDAGAIAVEAVRFACNRCENVDYPIFAMDHDGRCWMVERAGAPMVEQG